MKRRIVIIAGIAGVLIVAWWGIIWIGNGGWPATGSVGGNYPPHIQYVAPADGEKVVTSYGFCVHFYYQADHGIGDNPEQVIRYYLDGFNVTKGVVDIARIEYGYPDPVGEPCYTREELLSPGWHTVKVRYSDLVGERFEYTWRFQVLENE
jgi:hypothetical protein